MEEKVETGARLTQKPRKNVVYEENRVCVEDNCEQVLSKYNKQEYCFVHHKYVATRVRGIEIHDI